MAKDLQRVEFDSVYRCCGNDGPVCLRLKAYILGYSTMLNFGVLPESRNRSRDAIASPSVGAGQRIVAVFGNFRFKFRAQGAEESCLTVMLAQFIAQIDLVIQNNERD